MYKFIRVLWKLPFQKCVNSFRVFMFSLVAISAQYNLGALILHINLNFNSVFCTTFSGWVDVFNIGWVIVSITCFKPILPRGKFWEYLNKVPKMYPVLCRNKRIKVKIVIALRLWWSSPFDIPSNVLFINQWL